MNVVKNEKKVFEIPPHKSIWDVPDKYHLSIIAICLSNSEQYRLMGGSVETATGAYCQLEKLTSISKTISGKSANSILLQQMLDKKYRLSLIRFGTVKKEVELHNLWSTYIAGGEFRGAYWAIMTHLLASAEVLEKVHRQLSIFSLRNCCMQLHQQKRVCELQKKIQSIDATLTERDQKHSKSICRYCSQIASLKSELSQAEYKVSKLERHLELVRFRNRLIEST